MKYLKKVLSLILSSLTLIGTNINAASECRNSNNSKKTVLATTLGSFCSAIIGSVATASIINFLKKDDDKLLEATLLGKNWCDSERAKNIWACFLNERAYHVYYLDSIFLFASGLSLGCEIPGIPKDKYAENYNEKEFLIVNVKAEEIENDIETMLKWWNVKVKNSNYKDKDYMSKNDIEFLTHVFRKFKDLKNSIN